MGSNAELERLAVQSDQREQELRTTVGIKAAEEVNLRVLTDDRAGYKEWHTNFINVMSQVRPGSGIGNDHTGCTPPSQRGSHGQWNGGIHTTPPMVRGANRSGTGRIATKGLRPMQAKREEDTARCIEEWQESIMELRRVDPDYVDLPDAYQTAALRGILTGNTVIT